MSTVVTVVSQDKAEIFFMILCLEEEPEQRQRQRYDRKNSASRLITTCQRYLQRHSSESSVSPSREVKKSSWYDGDVETSDSTGDSPGSSSGARAKIKELTRSFGKGKQEKQRPRISDIVTVVATTPPPPRVTEHSNLSQAEDAVMVTPTHDDGHSSPTSYQTADTDHSSETQHRKRVNLLIDTWEARGRDDGHDRGDVGVLCDKSSRTSVISSQSSDISSSGQTSSSAHSGATDQERREKKLYHAAREIMTSEKTFVSVLQLLNVDFRNFIEERIRDTGADIIPLQDFAKIFKTLPQLLMFNKDLLLDFEDRIENWDTLKKIADVIVKKGPFLKLYTNYVKDFPVLTEHFDKCLKNFPEFRRVVAEFERRDLCQNLRVSHYMLKPVQRLPQYKLMLEEYLKHLPQDSIDFDDTTEALKIVAEAAQHADDALEKGVSEVEVVNHIFIVDVVE